MPPPDTQMVETRAGRTGSQALNEIVDLCDQLRRVTTGDPSATAVRAEPNPQRDRLLYEYRRVVNRHIREDVWVNLAELQALAASISGHMGIDLACTPVGADAFARLKDSLGPITEIDSYTDAKSQEKWWYALHQFYLDGLALADRLLRTGWKNRQVASACRDWRRLPRRVRVPGLSCPGLAQTVITVAELNFPHVFRVNPFDTYMPTFLHFLGHHLFPRKPWRFNEMFETTLGWIRRKGFCRMGKVRGDAVSWSGVERIRNEHLFDTRTWRTRHNIIFACAHRFGFLDTAVFYPALRGIRLGVWADDSFYGPGVQKKISRDRYSITIRGRYCPSFRQSISETADLLVNAKVPVLIMVDGGQPPMFYGQQMSIKNGVRLAARAAVRSSAGTKRRTYVVPVSLNDPCGFVQGRQEAMRCTFHMPILIEAKQEGGRRNQGDTERTVNGGDPLLNHLEALFLLNTTHADQGLPHPRIVAAARRRLRNQHREPPLKRPFQTSLTDLASQAGW